MTESSLGTWRNPPLAYVVAEVSISPHYSIAQFVPSIQQSLRDLFPRTDEGREMVLAIGTPNQAAVPDCIWRLTTPDNRRGVNIGTRTIALHTTSYLNFLEFAELLTHVLKAVQSSELNPFVERIGLRYIDYILPSDGHQLVDYLVPALHGVTPPGAGRAQTAIWFAIYPFETFTVNARVAAPSLPGMLLPPNFSALPLAKPGTMLAAEQRVQQGQSFGIIDTDCSQSINAVFDMQALANNFAQLHTGVSTTFKALISDLAVKEWK